MGRRILGALAVIVSLLCLVATAHGAQLNTSAQASSIAIGAQNRSQLLQQINKNVTLEGYFYNDSIPMLVENLELVSADTPLPPDKYVPLTGTIPSSLQPGAKVKLEGKLQAPTGEKLQGENIGLQVTAQSRSSVVKAAPSGMTSQTSITEVLGANVSPIVTDKYALLIGTGMNYANDYARYWNDLVRMYQFLISKGYSPAHIRVCYANGLPKSASMPVHYPASMAGINAAFGYLAPLVKSEDTVYIMVSGQGNLPSQASFWTWQNVLMSGPAFSAQVNKITAYKQMTIQMNQSYSGGFLAYLTKPKRIILTSSAANKMAFAHPSLMYGNFNYWYLSALRKHLLIGEAVCNADANASGTVSLAEAYNFTLNKPGGGSPVGTIPPVWAQSPYFEDTGTPPGRCGIMPTAGEGAVGAITYL